MKSKLLALLVLGAPLAASSGQFQKTDSFTLDPFMRMRIQQMCDSVAYSESLKIDSIVSRPRYRTIHVDEFPNETLDSINVWLWRIKIVDRDTTFLPTLKLKRAI